MLSPEIEVMPHLSDLNGVEDASDSSNAGREDFPSRDVGCVFDRGIALVLDQKPLQFERGGRGEIKKVRIIREANGSRNEVKRGRRGQSGRNKRADQAKLGAH